RRAPARCAAGGGCARRPAVPVADAVQSGEDALPLASHAPQAAGVPVGVRLGISAVRRIGHHAPAAAAKLTLHPYNFVLHFDDTFVNSRNASHRVPSHPAGGVPLYRGSDAGIRHLVRDGVSAVSLLLRRLPGGTFLAVEELT